MSRFIRDVPLFGESKFLEAPNPDRKPPKVVHINETGSPDSGSPFRIYTFGGIGENGEALDTISRYDSVNNRFTLLPVKMGEARAEFGGTTVVLDRKWKIIIAGGRSFDQNGEEQILDSVEMFDVETETILPVGRLPEARADFGMASGSETSIIISGGYNQSSKPTRKCKNQRIAPFQNIIRSQVSTSGLSEWEVVAEMKKARRGFHILQDRKYFWIVSKEDYTVERLPISATGSGKTELIRSVSSRDGDSKVPVQNICHPIHVRNRSHPVIRGEKRTGSDTEDSGIEAEPSSPKKRKLATPEGREWRMTRAMGLEFDKYFRLFCPDPMCWKVYPAVPTRGSRLVMASRKLMALGGSETDKSKPTKAVHVYDYDAKKWHVAQPEMDCPRALHGSFVVDL